MPSEEYLKKIKKKIKEAEEKQLKVLDLSGDPRYKWRQLTQIPVEVFELEHLEVLNLSENQLTNVPESISKLQKLTELNLRYNQLTDVPKSISKLQNLNSLNLYHNQLTTVPGSISKLQKLKFLHLSHNQLTTVPKSISKLQLLTELYLNDNQLTTIPGSISLLQNLEILTLEDNPIENPPPEVVFDKNGRTNLEGIKNYYRQLKREKDYLYEAKLLIVGEAGAGKTTLAKKIEDKDYVLKENEPTTEGIDIIKWEFPLPENKNFRVNIWDFGGQEIYHATHQFFLTKRSLYTLVADTRKEDTDFYYWLNVVELLSDNSPLLIVKNEKQDRHREINERQLRGQFTNLRETLAANLATNRGLPEILKAIRLYISNLPHIGTELPTTWIKVRKNLENNTRNYISLDEYLSICHENGFDRREDKMQLSGYLHDLGVCLHFQDDPLLKKTVILKPTWGTDAVYKVLDNPGVIGRLGKFNSGDLAKIWHEEKYVNMQDELLQLMINFKLCYKIKNSGDYIAPQLLTANAPDYQWENRNNLIIRYKYEFMPKGILSRFIVETQEFIAEQKYAWRSGVILLKEGAKAEVIEYYGKREIVIRISGQNKKELMTIVTYELDKINKTFKRIKLEKLIPCNCSRCSKGSIEPHFYRLENLKKRLRDEQFKVQCDESYQYVEVLSLVDDFIEKDRDMGYGEDSFHQYTASTVRTKVFISYSHNDREWLTRLQKHLKTLEHEGIDVDVWDDTRIKAGDKWKLEIKRALDEAKIAVLLISTDFLASDFIAKNELPPLLKASKQNGAVILPLILKPSRFTKHKELSEFQAVNDPARPLIELKEAEQEKILVKLTGIIEDNL
jgi:GTPase SAR1 family protein